MKEIFKIEGMSCGGCVNGVKQALEHIPVTKATVYVGGAEVEYDESKVTHQQVVHSIQNAGFEVIK